jgi:two-component system sensor histidine kinase KdpD
MTARKAGPGLWRYPFTAGLVGLITAAAFLARSLLDPADMVMLYLLVVMVAAVYWGRGPAIFASVLSVATYNFFFVPPIFTFAVSQASHVITFAVMFTVGLLISGLTERIRREEHRARTEEMRSSLLSAVSHDLRTPLAAITGAATTLRDRAASVEPAQGRELLETICEEAERLERLVVNLLDMTRLESGTIEVKREWVPLEEIVGSALSRLEPQLAARTVRTELPADLPLLSVDPVLLGQVFVNLLENAVKHTPADSPIEIAARARAGDVEIEVADRGPGLPAGVEAQVFEKFFRARREAGSGVGLGLAICRGVVEAHRGRIVAEQRPGGGATFRITLPVPAPAPLPPQDEG